MTFQLFAVQHLVLRPGMSIAQATFWESSGESVVYEGKYLHATGPVASRMYLDWETQESS